MYLSIFIVNLIFATHRQASLTCLFAPGGYFPLFEVWGIAPVAERYTFAAGDDAVGEATSALGGILVETRFVVV